MGFSLRPLGRRITDIFDANTPQDQAKRVAAGRPANYYDQQKAPVARGIPYAPVAAPQRSGFSKLYDQVNMFDNNRTFKQATPTTQRSNLNQIGRNLNTGAFGVARSSVGIANDLSGFVDLITPGTGTNRFTNATRVINEQIDQGVKNREMSTGLYKGTQGVHQAGSFLLPGAVVGKATVVPKVVANGSKAAKVAKWATSPTQLINVATDAAQGAGFRTARGQDNSPLTAATDIATSYATAGTLSLASKGANKVVKKAVGSLRENGVMRPSNLSDVEVADLARFKQQAGTGGMMDDGVYERGMAAAQKAGIDIRPTSSDADNLIKAHQTFNVRKMQPRGETGGGFLGNEPTIKNMLGEDVPNPNYKPDPLANVAPQGKTPIDEGKVFYHGTSNPNVKSMKDLRAGSKVGSSGRNRVYVTENPNIAKNFGDNVVSEKLYGKHLDVREVGVGDFNNVQERTVAPEFADYKTTKLLTEREKRVFDNQFVRGVPNNTIIEDTPGIHKYLASKGYTTITVPRTISDVDGIKSETIIISDKAFSPPVAQVGKTDKPKVGLKKSEQDLLARVAYKEATDKAAMADAQNTVNKIREKAFREGNRNLTKNEMIKEALAMEKLTGVKPQGVPQAAKPKPKVIKYPPVGEITEAPKTPGAFQRSVRSIKGVLKQYGDTGKDAVKRLENARNNKEISTQAFLDKTKAVWDLDDSETIQFFQALKKLSQGEQPNMSPRVQKAVQEWSDNIPSVRERAVAAGIEVGDQGKFYAPQTHSNLKGDGEIKFINQMIAEGKATDIADARTKLQFMKNDNYKPFGSLEKSREVDMPGYDMTKKALSDYVARAHDTIATAEQFGPKGEGKMEILARLQQEGYNSSQINKAEEYLDKALKLKQYDATAVRASSAVRQANAFMTLGTAGVSNAGQVTNTMTVAGIGRTLKNMAKIATSKTSRAQADSMGVTLDHAISTIESQQVGTQNRILRNIASPLFREVERFNRRYTALVGEDFGNHLLQKGEFGTRKLQELGVTGEIGEKLTPNQIQQLSRGLVETTQFKVDPMDLPAWADSPLGKVVSQYKPFIYKQTEFMYHQVIKEAGKGNFAPLLRFLAVGVPIGLGGQKIKDVVKGRDSFKDEEGNDKSTLSLVDKGISSVGGYGMVDNARFLVSNAGSERLPQYVASSFGGPTAGNIAETAINVSKAAGKNKDMKPLGRQVLSKIPTVGPKVANTVLPYDEKTSSTPKKGETATPAQLDKQASEELKKLKENVKAGDNGLVQLPNGEYAATINGNVQKFKKLEDARHAARMDHALADGSDSKVLGDTYYYKNESGETQSMPKYKHEFDVADSQNQLDMYVAKDNEDYAGWVAAAKSQIKALETLRDKYNKDSQEDKVDDVQKKIETLKSSMRKYASYGGAFTKGKGGSSSAGRYHVSLNAGGSAPRVTSKTQIAALRNVKFAGAGTKPRVSSAKSRV